MKKMDELELARVNGGPSATVWGCIGVGIVFLASIIYGFINPNKCN